MIEEPNQSIKLEGITILLKPGIIQEQVVLPDGIYNWSQLTETLAWHWIPFMECHKCGRFSYCKYARPNPRSPNKGLEIRCGVALEALRNFLLVSWDRLLIYDHNKLQHFFNGLFYFVEHVYTAEVTTGWYLSRDYLDWAGGDLARRSFGYISHLRDTLDKFATEFRELEDFWTKGLWILVEGDAEKAFLDKLVSLGFFTSIGGIETYKGKGNAKLSKLYVESLLARGYVVTLQGDMDSSKRSPLENFVSAGLVDEWLIFPFTKDFEGAFPPELLGETLNDLGYPIDGEWLKAIMSTSGSTPIIQSIEKKTGKKVDKIELAKALAIVVFRNQRHLYERHRRNEITKWLMTLRLRKPLEDSETRG